MFIVYCGSNFSFIELVGFLFEIRDGFFVCKLILSIVIVIFIKIGGFSIKVLKNYGIVILRKKDD